MDNFMEPEDFERFFNLYEDLPNCVLWHNSGIILGDMSVKVSVLAVLKY